MLNSVQKYRVSRLPRRTGSWFVQKRNTTGWSTVLTVEDQETAQGWTRFLNFIDGDEQATMFGKISRVCVENEGLLFALVEAFGIEHWICFVQVVIPAIPDDIKCPTCRVEHDQQATKIVNRGFVRDIHHIADTTNGCRTVKLPGLDGEWLVSVYPQAR